MKYDLRRSPGARVVRVQALCTACDVPLFKPLEDDGIYKVLLSSFIVRGGDGYTAISDNIIQHDLLGKHVTSAGPAGAPVVTMSIHIVSAILRLTSTEATRLIKDGEKRGVGAGGGGLGRRGGGGREIIYQGRLYTSRYTVTTRMTPALRWAAMRAILTFH